MCVKHKVIMTRMVFPLVTKKCMKQHDLNDKSKISDDNEMYQILYKRKCKKICKEK